MARDLVLRGLVESRIVHKIPSLASFVIYRRLAKLTHLNSFTNSCINQRHVPTLPMHLPV